MNDYDVYATMNICPISESGEFNVLFDKGLRVEMTKNIQEIFEAILSGYVDKIDLFFVSNNNIRVKFLFICCDENEEEAESFCRYLLNDVEEELSKIGYVIKSFKCKASLQDMSWLEDLENIVFK